MKMIGMSVRSAAMRLWRSRPLRSGRLKSSIRQLGASTRGRERNSSAEAKVSGCQPAKRISDSSDSRTDASSSTTKTSGLVCDFDSLSECTSYNIRSVHLKRGIERLEQSRLAERLEQTLHGTPFEQAWTDRLIAVSGDENDRNRLMPA